jgi:hypothetical protein
VDFRSTGSLQVDLYWLCVCLSDRPARDGWMSIGVANCAPVGRRLALLPGGRSGGVKGRTRGGGAMHPCAPVKAACGTRQRRVQAAQAQAGSGPTARCALTTGIW